MTDRKQHEQTEREVRGWRVKAPPTPSAIHENEGIDGGF
jgi:hypothetical protein